MTLEEYLRQFGSSLSDGSLPALGVALVAGILASAVCPCTLPVGLGMAGVVTASESQSRRVGLLVALAFFLGIVANLTLLGAVAGRLGAILTESFGRSWALTMALVSLVAAIVAFRGPRLNVDQLAALRRPGLAGSFGYGFVFSLGTSAAPLLLLLTIAATQARPGYGAVLAFAFGLGRGLPFLLVGLFAGALVRLTRIGAWRRAIQAASGAALLLVSAYYARAFLALL
ncbi:cytochrome c biogenesis CcdA family protein [Tautonia sociabilis]|uniref:Thiol:disulfide interchange protein n=1 Tax=Tautonia sociabilis TaxID=2080755 RepID=A0A432ME97_9BACT|nr:cytochrome c biogenesis protein CcdA [Tautonia sociabilis]RUL83553.1 thiol:disulfide interchange protein [Tautonia sociabilis]